MGFRGKTIWAGRVKIFEGVILTGRAFWERRIKACCPPPFICRSLILSLHKIIDFLLNIYQLMLRVLLILFLLLMQSLINCPPIRGCLLNVKKLSEYLVLLLKLLNDKTRWLELIHSLSDRLFKIRFQNLILYCKSLILSNYSLFF